MAKRIIFNPLTNRFDYIAFETEAEKTTQINKIITHEYNEAGNRLQTYDSVSATHIDSGPLIVVDNDGNVVTS